jgi:hypothetical protein
MYNPRWRPRRPEFAQVPDATTKGSPLFRTRQRASGSVLSSLLCKLVEGLSLPGAVQVSDHSEDDAVAARGVGEEGERCQERVTKLEFGPLFTMYIVEHTGERVSAGRVSRTLPTTLSRTLGVPYRVFQPELRHRLADPSPRPIRLAPIGDMADLLDIFLGLRTVKPLQIPARLGDRPRTEQPLWALVSVQAGVNARPGPILRPLHQARTLGVSLHVANQRQEMAVPLRGKRLISALVN